MAYAQWVTITIYATNYDVTLKNVAHSWGKFYGSQLGIAGGKKDNEYQPDVFEGKIIKPKTSFSINACGRDNSASGTEGSFDFYNGDTQVGTYSWNCPWSGTNSSTLSISGALPPDNNYTTSQTGANIHDGALGTVVIQTTKIEVA